MAQASEGYDFRKVLDMVWDDLLDYMKLDPVLEELQNSKVFRPRVLRDLQEKDTTTTKKISALLQLLKDGDYTRYVQLKQCLVASGQENLVDAIEAAEKGEYKPVVRKKPRTEEEELFEVLKKDLIEYYRENESTMSVAPLVEQHEAEITKFYVRPSMMAYKKPNAFGQKKQFDENPKEKKTEKKTNITSYRELLLNGNDPYKRIYVTADAGMGKTSFAKMLAVTWCEANDSKDLTRECLEKNDLETMKKFDLLFLIKLREFETFPKCSLDEMILEMMKSKLPHKSQYTEKLLEKVLCNKRCLIIVDGLDEWIHPHTCRRGEVIPHGRTWPKCTVLTTTRPWKISSAQLLKADIDRQVEISQLDETTARKLESRAITFLNENQESQTDQVATDSNQKTVTDFEKSVPEKLLGHILYIPFVLLQMICLWFGNNPIGKSLCEVYSNIIELTLTRWLVKTDSGHTDCKCEHSKEHENIKLKCMENNRHCQRYMALLLKIGELAFSALFNVIREESLLFDRRQVLEYLSEEELEQCLAMGLLSQVKDTTSLTKVRLQLYFPHKTLQEFVCALFIATNWSNEDTGTMSIKQRISDKCISVYDIVEMSEVFAFVCGLNPEVYSDISRPFATIFNKDKFVIEYRNGVNDYPFEVWPFQHMQISCFLESTRNQHPECKIEIEDMFYDEMKKDEKQAFERILSDNACSLKSFTLYDLSSAGEIDMVDSSSAERIVRILQQAECRCLERLSVKCCEPTLLQSVLTTAPHTLKCLMLEEVSLTDDVCRAISTLNNLQCLYLYGVDVTSGDISGDILNAVSDCISGCMSLQQLGFIESISLSDTYMMPVLLVSCYKNLLRSIEAKTMLTFLALSFSHDYPFYDLNLSKHDKLQELSLGLPLEELFINTEQLVKCDFYSDLDVLSLLAELQDAPLLETLTLGTVQNPHLRIDITALPRLKVFALFECDLRKVILSPEMTSLETITLSGTTLSIPGWRKLFLSISKLPQPITMKLKDIVMTAGEWRALLFDILGKLAKSIHVEMEGCMGPSEEEWRHILDNMKESTTFCFTSTDYKLSTLLQLFKADISFDTVVV